VPGTRDVSLARARFQVFDFSFAIYVLASKDSNEQRDQAFLPIPLTIPAISQDHTIDNANLFILLEA
jgi:hypothetical protein